MKTIILEKIKDYESELERVSGDTSDPKYITFLMKRIDELYKKLDQESSDGSSFLKYMHFKNKQDQ